MLSLLDIEQEFDGVSGEEAVVVEIFQALVLSPSGGIASLPSENPLGHQHT